MAGDINPPERQPGELGFREIASFGPAPHQYRCFELTPEDAWLQEVAKEYVALRTACNFPLEEVQVNGLTQLDPADVAARIQAATVPDRVGGNFDVLRSDLGEVIAYLLLEKVYATIFGYKSVRDRELIHLPGRGIDAVGVEEGGTLVLCLGETKVSNEAANPPRVVDVAEDCLRRQHLGHVAEHEKTTRKLFDVARRARTQEQQALFLQAAMLFQDRHFDELHLVACSVLVRPQTVYAEADFGSFRERPADYGPADVRFLVVLLPEDVETIVDKLHGLVRELAA